jgi:hypothetical protein
VVWVGETSLVAGSQLFADVLDLPWLSFAFFQPFLKPGWQAGSSLEGMNKTWRTGAEVSTVLAAACQD